MTVGENDPLTPIAIKALPLHIDQVSQARRLIADMQSTTDHMRQAEIPLTIKARPAILSGISHLSVTRTILSDHQAVRLDLVVISDMRRQASGRS